MFQRSSNSASGDFGSSSTDLAPNSERYTNADVMKVLLDIKSKLDKVLSSNGTGDSQNQQDDPKFTVCMCATNFVP